MYIYIYNYIYMIVYRMIIMVLPNLRIQWVSNGIQATALGEYTMGYKQSLLMDITPWNFGCVLQVLGRRNL